jgi:hypothetical protein
MSHADIVFLAHYVGGGINSILDLYTDEFFEYLNAALEFYKEEIKQPTRVILSGIEKK